MAKKLSGIELAPREVGLVVMALGAYRESGKYHADGFSFYEVATLGERLKKEDRDKNGMPWALLEEA